MLTSRSCGRGFFLLLLIVECLLLSLASVSLVKAQAPSLWWNGNWLSCTPLNLTETYGRSRIDEPADVFIEFMPQTCADPQREIRVLSYDGVNWTEATSQVYNVTKRNNYAESCNIVFLANCQANSTVTYYVYYNNPLATAPVYDGLRLHEETAGESYNVTAVSNGVEKNYTHIFWMNCMDLYKDGEMVAWPGGPPGWEFCQVVLGSLWSDALNTPWFGAGKQLSLIDGGPLFVDFNYTEAYASDLWGGVYDHNVTNTLILRIFYRPNLEPLVYFKRTFRIVTNLANYTLRQPIFLDFKLADHSSRAIYQGFTWKALDGSTHAKKTDLPISEYIWSPDTPVGWWSYNGSRTDTTDKPKANIGMIPISAGGTVPGENKLQVIQSIENDDHHCSQWMIGDYNGEGGDVLEVAGYITTHTPVDVEVESVMEAEADRLRNPEPLHVSIGEPRTLQLVDRQPPSHKEIVPSLSGQEILEGQEVEVEAKVIDEASFYAEKAVQPSGVLNVSLLYSTDGGTTWRTLNMTRTAEENRYAGTLPSFESGTKVSYKIVTSDNLLNVGESSTFLYKIVAAPQAGLWFGLGFAVGAAVSIVLAAAAYYARKKG